MRRRELDLRELETVYREQHARFLRVAFAIVRDDDDAREAVQEAFARAIRSRASFRREGDVEAWLWRALVNICLDLVRRRPPPAPVSPLDATPEDTALAHDVRPLVARLPERQRLVLFLRHYADLSYDQIGAALGIERGTVAATLHAAHASLRSRLEEVPR